MPIKRGRKSIKKTFTNKERLFSLTRSTKAEEREAAYYSLLQVYKKNSGVLGETSDQNRFTYGKATDTVLRTFEDFHPKFREFAERIISLSLSVMQD
jgi:oligoendopeptidase F